MILDLFPDTQDTNTLYAGRYPMRPHPRGRGNVITIADGELFYAPQFFDAPTSDRAFARLLANDTDSAHAIDWRGKCLNTIHWQTIQWRQDAMQLHGKTTPLPRLSAWHGDDDRPYTYSGITLRPQPWNPVLAWLRDQLDAWSGTRFNSVLLNLYRDGNDHISWHTDAERELGTNPVIASVNFGATRRFLLRRNVDHTEKVELPLGHGSLLIMSGAIQHHWQHSVPKERRVHASRINLTFRVIHPGRESI